MPQCGEAHGLYRGRKGAVIGYCLPIVQFFASEILTRQAEKKKERWVSFLVRWTVSGLGYSAECRRTESSGGDPTEN